MCSPKRDRTIDILKGIGIILMVIGHAGCPHLLHEYIYTFHMPLFFIASGYFFTEKNAVNVITFSWKKIKGIYIPFVACSIAFLLLHNVFFNIGIINDSYGNRTGEVSYLYSAQEIISRALHIVFRMDKYEFFLLGAFWFLRALFMSSLILCFGTWTLNRIHEAIFSTHNATTSRSIMLLSLFCLLCGGIIKYKNISIPYIAQGGYREMMGVFFLGAGYFMKQKIDVINRHANVMVLCACLVSVVLFVIHPASLKIKSDYIDWAIIPFSGIAGTYIVYYISRYWSRYESSKWIAYIGKKSIWILVLHLLAFKVSELLEITVYDLPIQMIACHTVIPPLDNWFFVVHTVVAVSIPMFIAYCIDIVKNACTPNSIILCHDRR